jgi:hypothetical protein
LGVDTTFADPTQRSIGKCASDKVASRVPAPPGRVYNIMVRMRNNKRRSVARATFRGCLEDYVETEIIPSIRDCVRRESACVEGGTVETAFVRGKSDPGVGGACCNVFG